jgi:hypothetical protein
LYYVKVVTRGAKSTVKGTPAQALDYISDGHDARRDPGYSDAELAYIARMDEGWKTELEGGRVPLVGLGGLRGETDEKKMAIAFGDASQPHDKRATTGYKSITFTIPKEVSLFAEGHREEAKAAMYAAAQAALDRIYAGKRYISVAAIHTRNENGEIHYHAHVLVGKFALDEASGKVRSLNSKSGGNTGYRQLAELKATWKEAVDKEFRERLGLTIEQRAPNGAPALVLQDGTRLDALNRASRRQLEKDVAPWYAAPTPAGGVVQRQLHLGAMDDRIFEIAVGRRAAPGWDLDAFRATFPDQDRFAARYEKRVETLKTIGYLTSDGRVSPDFRLHFAIRHGVNTPELQRLRLDLANQRARAARQAGRPRGPIDLWEAVQRLDGARRRVDRLGFTRDDIRRIYEDAEKHKPSPERLRAIRIDAAHRALSQAPTKLPATKTIIRAYLDVQKAKLQRVYLVVSGAVTLRYGENKKLADKLRQAAHRDLSLAKDRRLAQLAHRLRPIFWAVKIALPREARRLEQAVQRCTRLAYSQEIRRIAREEISRAYVDWKRSFIERPRAELERAAASDARPGQAEAASRLETARARVAGGDLAAARSMYEKGYAAMAALGRPEAAALRAWVGREEELVRAVMATARTASPDAAGGTFAGPLGPSEHRAAVRAGQIGRLLVREEQAPVPAFSAATGELERLSRRLHAFDVTSPPTPTRLRALAPTELRKSLEAFRQAGVLGDGPGWTLKAAPARALAQDLGRTIDRAVEADRVLTDSLLKKRSGP